MSQGKKRRSSVTARLFWLVSSVLPKISNKIPLSTSDDQFRDSLLPTEGLYSEVVRNPEFFDRLRREEQILVAGPSTYPALELLLSVGFKTLNIQKSADDISKVLGSVKSEFHKFGGVLAKTQRHLKNASNNIDDLLTRRTSAIERTLHKSKVMRTCWD